MARLPRYESPETPDWSPTVRTAAPALVAWSHGLLRAGAGLLFMLHGLQKIFGLMGGAGGPGTAVPLVSLMGLAGTLELVGGALLVLGLFTRPVAAVLTIEMLAAFVIAHFPRGGSPLQNGGELPLLYALIFFFLATAGAGAASLDALFTRRRQP
jgi:putative oxidoreductase